MCYRQCLSKKHDMLAGEVDEYNGAIAAADIRDFNQA